MAEGDGFHPFRQNRPPPEQPLCNNDVGNQGRQLLLSFIHDRLESDGIYDAPNRELLVEPSTPQGPPIHHVNEVALALRRIGDELDGDAHLQRLIAKIPPDAPQQTFLAVAKEIFRDGNLNWGRITMLFYFAYKMIVKALATVLDTMPVIRGIIEWVVTYIIDNIAPWILERGGWESVQEYFGSSSAQFMSVLCTGIIISASMILYKSWK